MSTWRKIFVLWGFLCGFALDLPGQPAEAAFDAANKLYDQGKFSAAADAYMQMVREGNAPVAVYFNLGNALFKAGERGRAIAAYRIVEASTPRDPDLRANLSFALAQVHGPTIKEPIYASWIRRVNLNEWAFATSIGFWITIILLAVGYLRPQLKKAMMRYAMAAGALTLCAAVCLGFSVYQAGNVHRAIVISQEAAVRRGPLDEAETVFTVYDGAELRVLDVKGEWAQVAAGPGKSGWIKMPQIRTSARRN